MNLINNCVVSVLSPIYSLFSVASETKDNVESPVQQVPYGSTVLLKKLGLGFLGAAYVCMLLTVVLILASVVGVGLVRLWVEEPLFVKESLHFDYTDAHPSAVFLFDGGVTGHIMRSKQIGVPVGHTFDVSLVLVMPESDFNRELGVFQVCL